MTIRIFTPGNITVTVDLPNMEESILADQVEGPAKWIEGFANHVSDKIERHKQVLIDAEIVAARKAGTLNQLPATDDAIVQSVFAKLGYRNRAEREAEAQT